MTCDCRFPSNKNIGDQLPSYHLCCSHAASDVDCGDPNNASSEVIVQYTSTRVSSVIFYQCQQSGFAPSSLSAVCMENGMWGKDPSQVVCRMATATMSTMTTMSTMSTSTGRVVLLASVSINQYTVDGGGTKFTFTVLSLY